MEKISEVFEDLIRRNIAPSASFFVLLASGNLIAAAIVPNTPSPDAVMAEWISWFGFMYEKVDSITLLGALFLVGLVGLSYVLSTLSQVLYDNSLKRNFRNWFFRNNRYLKQYRMGACEKLELFSRTNLYFDRRLSNINNRYLTDYVLYEILGGIDPTDTERFVNDAKAYGIVFISSVIVVLQLGHMYCFEACGSLTAYMPWLDDIVKLPPWLDSMAVVFLLAAIILFFLGRETVKAQYRARALRLYVNFLAMPNARITDLLHGHGESHGTSGT